MTCPVQLSKRPPVLFVLSVDGYAIDKATPADAPAPELPKAVLISPDGTRVGTLPYAYPFDPPVTLDVTFANWSRDFPLTIELYLENPAVGGNAKLPPLKWNTGLKQYVESKSSRP